MTDQTYQYIAIGIYFLGMIAIGLWASTKNTDTEDYMLGGRSLRPSVAALSAGASDMSGWLVMGLPGAIYMVGLLDAWMAIGLTIGAWVNWKLVAPRLRAYSEVAGNAITIPSFFDNRLKAHGLSSRILRVSCGLIILLFFIFYVSSGMVAGGKFYQTAFGGDYLLGMLVIAGVTILYTLFGGFLGATFTDVAQGLLILVALVAVPIVAMFEYGGPAEVFGAVREANPDALSLTAGATVVGVASSLAWGLGYFGQPHIVVRFMALRKPTDAPTGRRIGISWMVLVVLGTVSTALTGIAYFSTHPEASLTDAQSAETVFLDLAQILFHPLVAGFVLAAVLAAIMSTVSSQLIVSSSAAVEDLAMLVIKRKLAPRVQLWMSRGSVLAVALIAAAIAFDDEAAVLDLVSFAWAGFGAAFGPLMLLALYWRKLTATGGLLSMLTGAGVTILWAYVIGDPESTGILGLYEIVPGFAAALVVGVVVSLATYRPSERIEREFEAARVFARTGEIPASEEREAESVGSRG
ncbi:sodium/proline symporter PutP [Rothia sp. AR01]|uniref:Sodium/proline symporter n=1 Tax=Rothia santali TaxID=2949643 RepID=A0A9X2HEJ8_9MICC|nr:sodium/proline symporter PutP [Rothia santali]MCP3426267.1 sodium/proline symporter PutP [Rothia santali]